MTESKPPRAEKQDALSKENRNRTAQCEPVRWPPRLPQQRRARPATTGLTVTRIVDSSGSVSFAGTPYRCGIRWARQTVDVAIVAGSVQLAKDGQVIRVHPIRHDRTRELGAFANPKGRPRHTNAI